MNTRALVSLSLSVCVCVYRPANINFAKVVLVLIDDFIYFGYAELKNYVNFFVSRKEFIQSGEKVVVKYIQCVVVFIYTQ
jgi:hypothetical protein